MPLRSISTAICFFALSMPTCYSSVTNCTLPEQTNDLFPENMYMNHPLLCWCTVSSSTMYPQADFSSALIVQFITIIEWFIHILENLENTVQNLNIEFCQRSRILEYEPIFDPVFRPCLYL